MLRPSRLLVSTTCLMMVGLFAWALTAAAQTAATREVPKVPARDVLRKNPIPADEGSRATGKRIYAGNCAPCHGDAGKGNGPVARLQDTPPSDLTDSKYAAETDGALYWKISNGHPPMPRFQNTLPDESRWNVVNYLRSIITPPATAPATSAPASRRAPP